MASKPPVFEQLWSMGTACGWIADRSDDAEEDLQKALISGQVSATGLKPDGVRTSIEKLEWVDMAISYDLSETYGLMHRAHNAAGLRYTEIVVPQSEILKLWPPDETGRAGRKAVYNWEKFSAEVIRVLDDEGDFANSGDPSWNQSTLERRLAEWCQSEWGKEPSESLIRKQVVKAAEKFREMRGR